MQSCDIMMTSSNGNIFYVTGPLCGEFTGHRWIPLTKASDAEPWCFLWSAPEPTVEQTIETLVIWDAIALIMTSLTIFFFIFFWGFVNGIGAVLWLPQCQRGDPESYAWSRPNQYKARQSGNRVHISWEILHLHHICGVVALIQAPIYYNCVTHCMCCEFVWYALAAIIN